jgi:hypothetical protein
MIVRGTQQFILTYQEEITLDDIGRKKKLQMIAEHFKSFYWDKA